MKGRAIPDGWYQLGRDEVVQEGDMFFSYLNSDEGEWETCDLSIGGNICEEFNPRTIVIRKSQPEPEKEWLNPWD